MLLMDKKKKSGRPAGTGKPKNVLHIEVPPELKAALVALADRNKRKITAEAIIAIEKHVSPKAGDIKP